MTIEIPEQERTAVRHALEDYLAVYTNPMILGPTPNEEKRDMLVSMARSWLRLAEDSTGTITLSMGEWTEEVTL